MNIDQKLDLSSLVRSENVIQNPVSSSPKSNSVEQKIELTLEEKIKLSNILQPKETNEIKLYFSPNLDPDSWKELIGHISSREANKKDNPNHVHIYLPPRQGWSSDIKLMENMEAESETRKKFQKILLEERERNTSSTDYSSLLQKGSIDFALCYGQELVGSNLGKDYMLIHTVQSNAQGYGTLAYQFAISIGLKDPKINGKILLEAVYSIIFHLKMGFMPVENQLTLKELFGNDENLIESFTHISEVDELEKNENLEFYKRAYRFLKFLPQEQEVSAAELFQSKDLFANLDKTGGVSSITYEFIPSLISGIRQFVENLKPGSSTNIDASEIGINSYMFLSQKGQERWGKVDLVNKFQSFKYCEHLDPWMIGNQRQELTEVLDAYYSKIEELKRLSKKDEVHPIKKYSSSEQKDSMKIPLITKQDKTNPKKEVNSAITKPDESALIDYIRVFTKKIEDVESKISVLFNEFKVILIDIMKESDQSKIYTNDDFINKQNEEFKTIPNVSKKLRIYQTQMEVLIYLSQQEGGKKLSKENVLLLKKAITSIKEIIAKSDEPYQNLDTCYCNLVKLEEAFKIEKENLKKELHNYKNAPIKKDTPTDDGKSKKHKSEAKINIESVKVLLDPKLNGRDLNSSDQNRLVLQKTSEIENKPLKQLGPYELEELRQKKKLEILTEKVQSVIDELKNYASEREKKGNLGRFSIFCPKKCGRNKVNAANKIINLLEYCLDKKTDLFLMSGERDIKISDRNHLYLYKEVKENKEVKFYYKVKGQPENQYLELSGDEGIKTKLKEEAFDQRGISPDKCNNDQIYKAVLAEISKKPFGNHLNEDELTACSEGGLRAIVEKIPFDTMLGYTKNHLIQERLNDIRLSLNNNSISNIMNYK